MHLNKNSKKEIIAIKGGERVMRKSNKIKILLLMTIFIAILLLSTTKVDASLYDNLNGRSSVTLNGSYPNFFVDYPGVYCVENGINPLGGTYNVSGPYDASDPVFAYILAQDYTSNRYNYNHCDLRQNLIWKYLAKNPYSTDASNVWIYGTNNGHTWSTYKTLNDDYKIYGRTVLEYYSEAETYAKKINSANIKISKLEVEPSSTGNVNVTITGDNYSDLVIYIKTKDGNWKQLFLNTDYTQSGNTYKIKKNKFGYSNDEPKGNLSNPKELNFEVKVQAKVTTYAAKYYVLYKKATGQNLISIKRTNN